MRGLGPAVAAAAYVLLSTTLVGQAAEDGTARDRGAGSALFRDIAVPGAPGEADAGGDGMFDCVMEPKLMIKLGTPDTGIIDKVDVDRGDLVHPTDVVATLDSQLQTLAVRMARLKAASDVDVKSEQARLSYRQVAAQRQEALHQKSFVSTKDYDEAMVEQKLAVLAVQKAQNEHVIAQEELAQAEARLARRSIHTPIGGVVVDITSKPGEYVYEQTPVMTIAEIDPLYVKVFVPAQYYGQIAVGTEAEVMPAQPIGGVYRARVSVVDKVFDAASATFAVRLVLPNPKNVLPAGVRCRVRFPIKEAAPGGPSSAVPLAAVPKGSGTPAR